MKIFVGHVISTKMAKTATVSVERIVIHPLYKKRFKRDRKYQVHDENSTAKVGDWVKFVAGKTYSKTKKWALLGESKKVKELEKVKTVKKVVNRKAKK